MNTLGIMIGIVVGCVIAAVIIAVVLIRRMRTKRRHARDMRTLLEATILDPRFCKYLVDNGHLFTPAVTWPLLRSVLRSQFDVDHGEAPDWEYINAEYDAEMGESPYRSSQDAPPASTNIRGAAKIEAGSRGIPDVSNDISAMLEDFDAWKAYTDAPNEDGESIPYTVHYVYLRPDGRPMRTTRRRLAEGDLPSGKYEIRILDSSGNEVVERFTGENL